MKLEQTYLEQLMDEALKEAEKAYAGGEVPIGAVIADEGGIIARAHNLVETLHDATAHAEAIAIREAAKSISNWRLSDLILVSTLEPCTMCCGAIKLSRVPVVVYGAPDPRAGAFGSIYDLSIDSRSGLVPRVIAGVRHDESVALLKRFFKERVSSAGKSYPGDFALN